MLRPASILIGASGVLIVATAAIWAGENQVQAPEPVAINKVAVIHDFVTTHPGTGFRYSGERIDRVFGPAFSNGDTAQQSASRFVQQHSGLWGVPSHEVLPIGPFDDGRHVVPMMFDQQTGEYKFTGLFYTQQREGIPVFDSKFVLLVRNEPNFPLVLASSSLRDLGAFQVSQAMQAVGTGGKASQIVRQQVGDFAELSEPELVIWAGVDEISVPPVLAQKIITVIDDPANAVFQAMMYIADAATGNILHTENLVYDVDVSGNMSGRSTTGSGADICGLTIPMLLPYARASIGLTSVYADANGNFTIPNGGAGAVTVTADLQGQYFVINNTGSPGGGDASISQNVTPPGPVNFLFNDPNDSSPAGQYRRAEVNAYVHANMVRDYVLAYHPTFPSVSTETEFPVNVNINQSCNAFYSPIDQTINFYVSGGADNCSNTANSTVVHHEYGHRIVNAAGSGQGAYGEGFGDVMGVLITDQPCLGAGFSTVIETTPCSIGPANCSSCLRTADNTSQYQTTGCSSCGSTIHSCGRLISGCVWSTRNYLAATHPATYRDIVSSLTINSVLLHTGTTITPSITVDFLTLDDDDADISNGTPHYNQINNGFTDHNMPGPPLSAILITYPNGRPDYISPTGGTTMRVDANAGSGAPQPNTGKLFVSTGGAYTQHAMTQLATPNQYEAVFPAFPCGTSVRYYVSVDTTAALPVNSPTNAPASYYSSVSAAGAGPDVFVDNFQSDLGWTVSNSAGLTTGQWQRGVPVTPAPSGAPGSDADGSGACYITHNSIGNFDIDGGSTTLTSPIMDASVGLPVLSYYRWYNNNTGNAPQADTMIIEISSNGGGSWITLETVGPTTGSPNPEVTGGWFQKSFNLASIGGFALTDQFRIRFTASDLGSGSIVEAGVDGVKIGTLECIDPETCPGDLTDDGQIGVADLLIVINSWGPCPGCPADLNDDNQVGVPDMLEIINNWGACP